MKKAIKEKWLKALRSGEYSQNKNYLKRPDNRFCCLGVLCDLHKKDTKEGDWEKCTSAYDQYLIKESETSEICFLPESVVKWAGLKDSSGLFKKSNGQTNTLMKLNDEGKSFKEISNYIEEYL